MNAKKRPVAAQKRTIQSYAFIDTNIFLDFYRTGNEASLSLLEKLKTVKDRILSTYQVEMEFSA
jgi:predicted nucleic acid-binding protein